MLNGFGDFLNIYRPNGGIGFTMSIFTLNLTFQLIFNNNIDLH